MVAVPLYLRYNLSYRDVEELLIERGAEVDHVTVFRRVQRFTPLLADAARWCRHAPGDRWYADETYVKTSHELGLSSSSFLILLVWCPGDVFVVFGVVLEAAVQDADEAVAELAARGVVAGASGAQLVVVGASSG